MFELQHAVGKRLAQLSGAESGMVTSGAAGAMAATTAACMAGTDPAHMPDELRAALNESTAMVYTAWRDDRVEKLLAITQPLKVPQMADDAAGIPPIENRSHFAELGVDLYRFSGGTSLYGPQCSELL